MIGLAFPISFFTIKKRREKKGKEKHATLPLLLIEPQFPRNLTLLYLNQADDVREPN